jgi:hypothetical protein
VNLYIHSPIRLHGVVLNLLSTGTTLPFTLQILNNIPEEITPVYAKIPLLFSCFQQGVTSLNRQFCWAHVSCLVIETT